LSNIIVTIIIIIIIIINGLIIVTLNIKERCMGTLQSHRCLGTLVSRLKLAWDCVRM